MALFIPQGFKVKLEEENEISGSKMNFQRLKLNQGGKGKMKYTVKN